jgi:drug/metabolite transporter (DMT)-like permease
MYFLLILTTFFWGSSWVVVKQLSSELDPILIATLRFALVSVFFLPVAIWLDKKGERIKKKDLGIMILLGLFGVTLLYILQYYGISLTSTVNASLMISFNPATTLVLSSIFLKEKIEKKKMIAIIIAFFGAFLVISNGNMLGTNIRDIAGALLSLGSTTCWAAYTILSKRTLKKYSPLLITVYTSIIGVILLIPFALFSPLSQVFALSPYGWAGLLWLAVTCTVFGYSVWSYSLERIDASSAAIFVYLVPIFAVVLSYLFRGESITLYTIFGGLLIFAGVYYSTRAS